MSLFDVIRYPISDPPTEAEFAALPIAILEQWWPMTEWTEYRNLDRIPFHLCDYYNYIYYDNKKMLDDSSLMKELDLLRKIIREYDEPI
jgi:hypothetical protein